MVVWYSSLAVYHKHLINSQLRTTVSCCNELMFCTVFSYLEMEIHHNQYD